MEVRVLSWAPPHEQPQIRHRSVGASGFTGRQTVEYCRQFAPAGLSWAIAGRNRSKLDSVNLAGADVLVADAQDESALDNLARQTRVVASTAGPFGLYGTKLLDACVRNRTHYCDITGEWVAPFLVGSINTRVVRRTQALLGNRFDYQEYSKFGSSGTARTVAIGGKVFESIAASGFGRRILKRLLPKPGEGPSEKVMNEGFFECEFIATDRNGGRVARNPQRSRRCGQPHHGQVPVRIRIPAGKSARGGNSR